MTNWKSNFSSHMRRGIKNLPPPMAVPPLLFSLSAKLTIIGKETMILLMMESKDKRTMETMTLLRRQRWLLMPPPVPVSRTYFASYGLTSCKALRITIT